MTEINITKKNRFSKRIGTRIASLYIINIMFLLVFIVIIFFVYKNISYDQTVVEKYTSQNAVSFKLLSLLNESVIDIMNILYNKKDDDIAILLARNEDIFNTFDTYKATAKDYNFKEDIVFANENENTIMELRRDIVKCTNLYREKNYKEAVKLYNLRIKDNLILIKTFIDKSSDNIQVNLDTIKKNINASESAATNSLSIAFLLIIVTNFITGRKIRKSIVNPLNLLKNRLQDIYEGGGDLTAKLDIKSEDEIGEVADYFNLFVDKIRNVIKNVKDTAFQLATTSEQMSSAAGNFAEHAQHQAAYAEEINGTIIEISKEVDHVYKGANNQDIGINQLVDSMSNLSIIINKMEEIINESKGQSDRIRTDAESGEESLKKMTASMNNLAKSSAEMSNIVELITSISDEINLLSLNAAIESARAGEAGRGFAVVADEISKLADQTANSINQIDSLIKINSKEIDTSNDNLNDLLLKVQTIIDEIKAIYTMMNNIIDFMNQQVEKNKIVNIEADKVRILSSEIKNSTDEQKNSVNEIVTSIEKINELTQTNASGAEQMLASAEEVASMSVDLQNKVNFFKC